MNATHAKIFNPLSPQQYYWSHSADCEYVYEEMGGEIKAKLMALADDACTYMHGKRYL